jgi:rhamnogalacturonan endolyase
VANDVSLVTATAVNAVSSAGTVIQYMATRRNENTIYMATYTTAEPDVGELRWITRLKGNILVGVAAPSNNTGTSGPIESTDINGHADGHTTSKYYGNDRAKDLSVRGVTGTGVGVFMVYGSREGSSGGPFFRDIQNQSSTAADSELYNYMNSGHNQTEADRMGLHGPYALRFTTGCTPALPDFSWMSSLNLTGWVGSRGTVAGTGISGMDGRHTYLVGFANATAQYWVAVDPSTGAFTSPNMQPGTYAVTVYKGELGVWTGSITVTAGATADLAAIAITADPSSTTAIWRIGDWDGTPLEFNNGANIGLMHPSDVRMNSWGPVTYTVGTSAADSFPAVQFRGDNTPTTVKFNLSASQVAAHTVRIGITSAYAGGRPALTVNSWSSSTPAASIQPDSRSITIGTYRGNNTTYTYDVPASAFVSGANTLMINVASGSSDLGAWLSASWSYDCVDLD